MWFFVHTHMWISHFDLYRIWCKNWHFSTTSVAIRQPSIRAWSASVRREAVEDIPGLCICYILCALTCTKTILATSEHICCAIVHIAILGRTRYTLVAACL